MQVMKFGGTSVANADNMLKVTEIVAKAAERDRTILVVSAISGCTDTLIKIGTLAPIPGSCNTGLFLVSPAFCNSSTTLNP